MDPLGAQASHVDQAQLPRWSSTTSPEYDIMVENPDAMRHSPFRLDATLNEKIVVWSGDLTQLNTDAIVNSTNEMLSDRSPTSERIMKQAGPDLVKELKRKIKSCRTGEAKVTKGYQLPARYVIHTVGPRYNLKYKTAAESALFNCYRSVLQIVREKSMSTVGICCVHSNKRGYPSHEGGHIAIRTLRRFLEKYGSSVDTVILVANGNDEDVYRSLLPLYFPRSQSEEDFAAYHLPDDVGNEDGEPVIAERQIRILGKPTHANQESRLEDIRSPEELEESVNINEAFETSVCVGAHSFARMESNPDKRRIQRLRKDPDLDRLQKEQYKRYERWLRRARQEDLHSIEQLRCLYQSGFDCYGRPVIVFIGKYFPATAIDFDKAMLHFIQLMDSVVNKPYVVVYLHTETSRDNHPDTDFLKDIYYLVDGRYRHNLGALYIVHPTFWSKILTWFFTTFNLSDVKPKVHNIPGLEYLYKRIPPDQLDLPDFVHQYDLRVHGTRYYDPEEDQSIGAL